MFNKVFAGLALSTAMLFAVPASATDFSFLNAPSSSVTKDGITVTASAWWTPTNATSSQPQTSYLGRYDKGLGSTNLLDGLGIINNSHTIDNINGFDFIKLTFSTAVNLTGMTLNGFPVTGGRNVDTDSWVSYGNGGFGTASAWKGYLNRGVEVDSGTSYSSNNFGNVWLIGASRSSFDRDDGFKLGAISVRTPSAVPEPATWAMMIGGVGMVGGAMRRRRRSAPAAFA